MKYLLCEAHGIGDCILILPVAKAIKKKDPNAHIIVFTKSDRNKILINKAIMGLQHNVDGIEYYSVSEKWHSFKFLIRNMLKHYDYGIAIQDYDTPRNSIIPSIILRLCAKRTCGTRVTQRSNIKYDMYVEREEALRRDYYFYRAFDKLCVPYEKDETHLLAENLVQQNLPSFDYDITRKTVAIVLGTAPISLRTKNGMIKNDAKSWPFKNWCQLTHDLSQNGINVILLGGVKEREDLKTIGLDFNFPNVHDFVGKLKIEQSIAILGIADVVVGADTGLMHCAGALDKVSLTLFGCTDWHEYLPFGNNSHYMTSDLVCSPCFGKLLSVTCKHKSCMKGITVEKVFLRLMELIM